jgi:hypothetical protein
MLPMDRVIDCVFAFRLSHAARNPFQTQEKAGGVRAEMCGQVPSAERLLLVESWSAGGIPVCRDRDSPATIIE